MKTYFFIIPLLLFSYSCKKEAKNQSIKIENNISKNVRYSSSSDEFELKSTIFTYNFPKSTLPFKRIILLNASLSGYISALNSEDKIIGVTSPEYIYSEKIHHLIDEGKIANVGNDQKYEIEKIISLKPDAIFTNYIPNFENTYDVLRKSGIEIIFLNEYSEELPLEKSAYIKVFGELLGKKNTADSLYQVIEKNYNYLKNRARLTQKQPLVLTNEMYGNQWHMPGGKTQIANYLKDANAEYLFKDNTETKSVPFSFEEVYALSENAEYWVNVGNYSTKKELLAVNPLYEKLNVFNKGKIFSINGRTREMANDYFESGAVRVDWVLKDYIKAFHPKILRNEKYTYIKELK